jgi:hypothetical protein
MTALSSIAPSSSGGSWPRFGALAALPVSSDQHVGEVVGPASLEAVMPFTVASLDTHLNWPITSLSLIFINSSKSLRSATNSARG